MTIEKQQFYHLKDVSPIILMVVFPLSCLVFKGCTQRFWFEDENVPFLKSLSNANRNHRGGL